MRTTLACLCALLIGATAGCTTMLPPQGHVTKDRPEVQSEYSGVEPGERAAQRLERLRDVLQVGTKVELLYARCGEPTRTAARGRRLIYNSCEGSGRFIVKIRKGEVVRVWY